MNERILITGGAGFIGANLAAALVKRPGIDVVVLDDFSFGDWKNLLHVDCEVRAGCISAGSLLDEIADGAFSAILHQGAIPIPRCSINSACWRLIPTPLLPCWKQAVSQAHA